MKRTLKGIGFLLALGLGATTLFAFPQQTLDIHAEAYGPYYNKDLNHVVDLNPSVSGLNRIEKPIVREKAALEDVTQSLEGFVEDVTQRTAVQKVYVHEARGEERIVTYFEPVHERVNGIWEVIDTTFEKETDGYASTTTTREVTVSDQALTLKSETADDIGSVSLEVAPIVEGDRLVDDSGSIEAYATKSGLSVRKTVDSEAVLSVDYELDADKRVEVSPSNQQINIYTGETLEATIAPTYWLDAAGEALTIQSSVSLTQLSETTYRVTIQADAAQLALKRAPFTVDVEMRVTKTYGTEAIQLYGVRSGTLYQDHSYNVGSSWVDTNRVVIGNASYNSGAILGCSSDAPCESNDTLGLLYFHNGQSMSDIIGTGRVVQSAKLTLWAQTDATAVHANGVKYALSMLDPEKAFDVTRVDAITYTNYQTYLQNSAAPVRSSNTTVLKGDGWQEVVMDVTEIFEAWQQSGLHHGIQIKAISDGTDASVKSANIFYNHAPRNGTAPSALPSITVTTVKEEPVSETLPLKESIVYVRPFTSQNRNLNLVYFGALGFDAKVRPGSVFSAKVVDSSGNTLFEDSSVALSGYRSYSQYTEALGYHLIDHAQVYYRLTSNVQLPNLMYNTEALKAKTLYTIQTKVETHEESTGWVNGDTFIVYTATGYDRLSRLLAFYGVDDKTQFMQDNNLSDELLVAGNVLFIRNPTQNQTQSYQPQGLSDDDKRMIDADLLGRNQHCVYGFEPINFNTGNFLYENSDLGFVEFDEAVNLTRSYNSLAGGIDGILGRNWHFSLDEKLYFLADGVIEYVDPTGRIYTFVKRSDGSYETPYGTTLSLTKVTSHSEDRVRDTDYYDMDSPAITEQYTVDFYQYILTSSDTDQVRSFNHIGNLTELKLNQSGDLYQYLYDDAGLLKTFISATGKHFTFEYNENAALTKIIAPNGTMVQYGYDSKGNLTKFVDQMGFSIDYHYDENHGMLSYTSREDGTAVIKNTYDAYGRVTAQMDALGNESTFNYTEDYTEITDYKGNVERVYTTERGTTQTVVTISGQSLDKAYDANGNLTWEIKEDGLEYYYTYDENGHLTSETDALGRVRLYEMDAKGNVIQLTDAQGNITRYTYDQDSNVIRIDASDGTFKEMRYESGRLVYEKDYYGLETRYTYTDQMLTQVLYSDGTETTYTYDLLGFLTSQTNRQGALHRYTYDERGLLISESVGSSTYHYQYNADGECVSVTDAMGNVSVYSYDGWSRVIAVTDALGTTQYAYDENGNIIQETNALGDVKTTVYNALNQKISTTDEAGNETLFEYDALGRLIKTTFPYGGESINTYNEKHQLIRQTDNGQTTTYTYDENGNLTHIEDAFGRETVYQYDVYHRLESVTDIYGDVTTYTYEGARRLSETKQGRTTTYVYDFEGNRIRSTTGDGSTHQDVFLGGAVTESILASGVKQFYSFEETGQIAAVSDEAGNTTAYVYDKNGNLIECIDPNGNQTTYRYNSADLLVEKISPEGTHTTYTYDALGRVTSETMADRVNGSMYTTTTTYTKTGQIASVQDALGRVTTYTYDLEGRVVEMNAYGRITTYTYNAYGLLIATSDHVKTTEYTYDEKHQLVFEYDSLGYEKTIVRNDRDQIIHIEDNRRHSERLEYDVYGNVTARVDARGNRVEMTYDAADHRIEETDVYGNITRYTYNEIGQMIGTVSMRDTERLILNHVGQVTEIQSEVSGAVQLTTDAAGNVLTSTNALGETTQWVYDGEDRVIAMRDALGQTTTYEYDARGNVIKTVYPDGSMTQSKYDAANRLVEFSDELGFVTQTVYDAYDQVIKTIDALGNATLTEYDSHGNAIKTVDANGHVEQTVYNHLQQPIKTVDALGNTTQRIYNEFNEVIAVVDSNGRTEFTEMNEFGDPVKTGVRGYEALDTVYRYDIFGRQIQTQSQGITETTIYDALGNVVGSQINELQAETIHYDETSRPVEIIDAYGVITTFEYDRLGRIVRQSDSNGYWVEITYDAVGQRIQETDARGTTTYVYDARGRHIETIDRLGAVSKVEVDARGNPIKTINALNEITETVYDACGRVVLTRDEAGNETRSVYDPAGNRIEYQDEAGTILSFKYDALNREIAVYYGETPLIQTKYDVMGNVIQVISNNRKNRYAYDLFGNVTDSFEAGIALHYDYDALNRLVKKTSDTDTFEYAYDAQNNLVRTTSAAGETIITYDVKGAVTSMTDVNGYTVEYTYDQSGNIATLHYPSGKTVSYTYDALNRLIQTQDETTKITYGYDAEDRVIHQSDGRVTLENTYNQAGQILTQKALNQTTHAIVSHFEYAYNVKGLLESQINHVTGTQSTYTYDARNQLLSETTRVDGVETVTHFEYDLFGNRTKETITQDSHDSRIKTYHFNMNQQLETVTDTDGNDIQYRYDTKGNIIAKRYSNGFEETYTYDAQNQLIEMKNNDGRVLENVYDALGNRVSKTETVTVESLVTDSRPVKDEARDSAAIIAAAKQAVLEAQENARSCTYSSIQDSVITHHTDYVNDVLLEHPVVLETVVNGDTASISTYGLSLEKYDTMKTSYTVVSNYKRDIVGTVDRDETIVTYDYTVFGRQSEKTALMHGYSGEIHEGSLQYLRARYYDTETGVFMSQDTYRGQSSDLLSQNRYAYVANNPLNAIDPSGHVARGLAGLILGKALIKEPAKKVTTSINSGGLKSSVTVTQKLKATSSPATVKTGAVSKGLVGSSAVRKGASAATSTVKTAASAKSKANEVQDPLYKVLQAKEAEWKRLGYSDAVIKTERAALIQKYCDTKPNDAIITSSKAQLQALDNYIIESASKAKEQPKKWWETVADWTKEKIVDPVVDFVQKEIIDPLAEVVTNIVSGIRFIVDFVIANWESIMQVLLVGASLVLSGILISSGFGAAAGALLLTSAGTSSAMISAASLAEVFVGGLVIFVDVYLLQQIQFQNPGSDGTPDASQPSSSEGTGNVNLDVKPEVENSKLKNIVNDLYKGQDNPNSVGNGTTMDAVRNELITGEPTFGRFHTQKLNDYMNGLNKLLNGGTLNQSDTTIVEALISDIINALGGN